MKSQRGWRGSGRTVDVTYSSFPVLSLLTTIVLILSGVLVRSEGVAGLALEGLDNASETGFGGDSEEGVESVTFVTEDESYDDENSGATESWNQRNERGRRKEDERCPPLPEPSLANARLCEARKCMSDVDCRANRSNIQSDGARNASDTDFICCFNGCVHSCLPKVDPPAVFDWLEETNVNKFLQPPENSSSEENFQTKSLLMSAKEAPETIALPGGCLINSKQYEDLLLFRKNQHVSSCSCSGGDVVCHVINDLLSTTKSPQ